MSKEPGTPPTGETVSATIAPQSRPIEANELDDGWGDEPIEASLAAVHTDAPREPAVSHTASPDSSVAVGVAVGSSADLPSTGEVAASQLPLAEAKRISSILPQSLSPVVLSNTEGSGGAKSVDAIESTATVKLTDVATKIASAEAKSASAKPASAKPASAKPAETKLVETKAAAAKEKPKHSIKSHHAGSRLRNRLKSGYVIFPVAVLAAGIALIVLRPKQLVEVKPSPAQAPAAAAQVPAQAVPQALVTPKQEVEQATASANAVPVDSVGVPPLATAAASAGPLPSASAASGESFVDAFHKNAAKSNAKWAEVKATGNATDNGKAGTAKPVAAKPQAAKPGSPGQADPLDVLKRLEEARKNKK